MTLLADTGLDPDSPFTFKMAMQAGVSRRQLQSLLQTRLIRRAVKGVYLPSTLQDSILTRARSLALVVPEGWFVTDRCAGWLHGASMVLAPNEDLVVPPITFFRNSGGGRVSNTAARGGERRVTKDDLTVVHGIQVTTPLRTALDLGRLQRRDLAMAGMDAMARLNLFPIEQLVIETKRFAGQRGVRQLRALAPLVDSGSESFGESALRLRWYDAGLPRPQTQIPILDGGIPRYYLDMGLEEYRYAVEYDGVAWHVGHEEHDESRRSWVAEHYDYVLDVFTKVHVFGLRQCADQVISRSFARVKRAYEGRPRVW